MPILRTRVLLGAALAAAAALAPASPASAQVGCDPVTDPSCPVAIAKKAAVGDGWNCDIGVFRPQYVVRYYYWCELNDPLGQVVETR